MIIPIKNMSGAPAPHEYLPASAIAVKYGMAMVFASGKLAKCGAEATPEYICMHESEGTLAAGDIIPVVRVSKDETYETVLSAAGGSLKLGDKVTIATDGLRVTATTTNGVAEIVAMDGTASGSKVRVKF